MRNWFSTTEVPTYPPLRACKKVYVFGDIHGCAGQLIRLQQEVDLESGDDADPEIYLGDYIDRGPRSAEVIDLLIRRAQARPVIVLKGNHEVMLNRFLAGTLGLAGWLRAGALETLVSYGVRIGSDALDDEDRVRAELRARMGDDHLAFLRAASDYVTFDGYFFTHAGVRPGIPLDRQVPEDLAWIREGFLQHRGDFGAVVVHGHTPEPAPVFLPNRIGIDTGAFATGRLTCLELREDGLHRYVTTEGETADWHAVRGD